MKSSSQKIKLLAHITLSVGWFGAVLPYLALAIASIASHDEQMVRAACLSMKVIGWYVLVPFSLAALLSGLVQSLGTGWGLFRHWWVLVKFALTIFAVVILFQHMHEVNRIELIARQTTLSSADLQPELIHSAGGLLVLFAAMVLSVFKPWGMTPHGKRQTPQTETVPRQSPDVVLTSQPVFHGRQVSWKRIVGLHAIGLFVLLAILHVAGVHPH